MSTARPRRHDFGIGFGGTATVAFARSATRRCCLRGACGLRKVALKLGGGQRNLVATGATGSRRVAGHVRNLLEQLIAANEKGAAGRCPDEIEGRATRTLAFPTSSPSPRARACPVCSSSTFN